MSNCALIVTYLLIICKPFYITLHCKIFMFDFKISWISKTIISYKNNSNVKRKVPHFNVIIKLEFSLRNVSIILKWFTLYLPFADLPKGNKLEKDRECR